jgi:hypothetical protein
MLSADKRQHEHHIQGGSSFPGGGGQSEYGGTHLAFKAIFTDRFGVFRMECFLKNNLDF